MSSENMKPQEQLTLEPYERDHAVVVGIYRYVTVPMLHRHLNQLQSDYSHIELISMGENQGSRFFRWNSAIWWVVLIGFRFDC